MYRARAHLIHQWYDLYWKGDRHGAFSSLTVIEMGVNYHDTSKRANLGEVRIGPFAMMYAFEVLYKCDSVSYALDVVTIFAINTSKAMRDEEIYRD